MASDQQTYAIGVDEFFVDRRNLGLIERVTAVVNGKWPKVKLHKIECPCCRKVTFHRAVQRNNAERR